MLIQDFILPVDFNGLAIFSYPDLDKRLGGIHSGDNILQKFIETDLGDEVMDEGLIVPVINMDDGDYIIRIFKDKSIDQNVEIKFQESGYPLKITQDAFVADVVVFWDWEPILGWKKININPGFYSVDVHGVIHHKNGEHIAGYDFIFHEKNTLPIRTAKVREDSRVFNC